MNLVVPLNMFLWSVNVQVFHGSTLDFCAHKHTHIWTHREKGPVLIQNIFYIMLFFIVLYTLFDAVSSNIDNVFSQSVRLLDFSIEILTSIIRTGEHILLKLMDLANL